MRNDTRVKFNAYMAAIAQLNGIPDATTKFAVTAAVQQTLEAHIQESSQFLTQINNTIVTEASGEKLGLGIGSTIASNTDTTTTDRTPTDPSTLDSTGYTCTQTNFDTLIRYAKLDAWAKFPNFQTMIRDQIIIRQALDIIMIGWNGTSRAATSDRTENPLLQDVNVGWFQKLRAGASARVMTGGKTDGKVVIGSSGDYATLDAAVYDAVNNLIDAWHREDTELVCILGRDLLADKYFPMVNTTQPPTEQMAADMIISQKRVGGLQAVRVPFFPTGSLFITRLDNLSRYIQEGGRRRTVIDNPKRDQIENYESSNDAYVIEDYGMCGAIENIEFASDTTTS